jgi:hypothetical protein
MIGSAAAGPPAQPGRREARRIVRTRRARCFARFRMPRSRPAQAAIQIATRVRRCRGQKAR